MQYRVFGTGNDGEAAAIRRIEGDMQAARLSWRFRIYYRLVRPLLPLGVRQWLQRSRRVDPAHDWYIPADFMRDFLHSASTCPTQTPIIHPWPGGTPFAFVLTHDVETAGGMRHAIRLANLEQDLGFRSSFNLVACKYKIDEGIVKELRDRGFEIGIHGYNHDGRLYWSNRTFQDRVAPINAALKKYGAVGFRSPMVHRNLKWLQALDIEYDASCFDADPYQAMPGGVGGIWPFMAGKFVELPYTLPQDHTLFIAQRQRDARIWEEKLLWVVRHYGMALMLTHPDYLIQPESLRIYQGFLSHVKAQGGYWHALPKEAAAWWKERDASRLEQSSNDTWRIAGPAAKRGTLAMLRVENLSFSLSSVGRSI